MCDMLGWATSSDHICPHKQFEASKRLDYLEECKASWVAYNGKDVEYARAMKVFYTVKIEALKSRTPEQKQKDDDLIAQHRAAIEAVRAAACTCGSKERFAALPPMRDWHDFRGT